MAAKPMKVAFAWNSCGLVSGLAPCLDLDKSPINQDNRWVCQRTDAQVLGRYGYPRHI